MDRALPEGNPIIHKRLMQQQLKRHKDRMKYMTKRVDNNLPVACYYPISNAKKDQIIEGT